MLSPGAFNALLKTLEEPPEHVIFILATTEVHKLPATILSRCQRFDFKRIDTDSICRRIQYIANKEGLTVTDGAATLIAAAADGGMRDALSVLDLCASGNKTITEETVENVCGMAGGEHLIKLADFINKKDSESALMLLDKLYSGSVDMVRLLSELTSHYRDLMIIKTVKGDNKPIVCSAEKLKALKIQAESYDIKDIMHILSSLQSAFATMQNGDKRCEMEMTLIKLCTPSINVDISSLERRITALENGVKITKVQSTATKAVEDKNISEEINEEDIPMSEPPEEAPENDSKVQISDIQPIENWSEILRLLKTSCPLICGVLSDSSAYIKGDYLLIDAPNSQFRSLINSGNSTFKDSIRKAAQSVLGKTYKLGPYVKPQTEAEQDPLAALSNKLKNLEIN